MSEYKSMKDVVEAFRSSTFSNPKLTFGSALEILVEEYELSQDDASLALVPEMVEAKLLEIWKAPEEEE
jgi:hypothetical protein